MGKTLLALCLLPVMAMAQSREFTLATYNSLRYSPTNIDARHPHFRLILNDLQPDVLVLQELSGASSANMFLDSVLNLDSSTYSLAPFIDGNGMDAALFYKSAMFSSLSTLSHPTQLRDIAQFRITPKESTDTLHVFGVHLKASTGTSNQDRRAAEVEVLRNLTKDFSPGTNFIVCGDFNIYSANEPAYQALLADEVEDEGHFIDAINITGTFNNPAYAQYHSQSPRTTQFNGGAHGGMDDRFDMILYSQALSDSGAIDFIPGSMYVYGNDGQHYDKAITDPPINSLVSAAITNALHLASDHLPVVASFEYEFSGISVSEAKLQSSLFLSHSPESIFIQNPEALEISVSVFAVNGQRLKELDLNGDHHLNLKSGFYILVVKDAQNGEPLLVEKIVQ